MSLRTEERMRRQSLALRSYCSCTRRGGPKHWISTPTRSRLSLRKQGWTERPATARRDYAIVPAARGGGPDWKTGEDVIHEFSLRTQGWTVQQLSQVGSAVIVPANAGVDRLGSRRWSTRIHCP
jgi:hypothetical protein